MPYSDTANPEKRMSLTRREALAGVWLTALAAAAAASAWLAQRFARPAATTGQFGGLFDMGGIAELPAAGAAPRHEPVGRFWLVRAPAGLLALHKACTHLECLCAWDPQTNEFVCPCHGSRFASDGALLTGPAPRPLDRFAVRIEDRAGNVVAETDATGAALPVAARADTDEWRVLVDTGQRMANG